MGKTKTPPETNLMKEPPPRPGGGGGGDGDPMFTKLKLQKELPQKPIVKDLGSAVKKQK